MRTYRRRPGFRLVGNDPGPRAGRAELAGHDEGTTAMTVNEQIAAAAPRWIPVSERLPDAAIDALWHEVDGESCIGYLNMHKDCVFVGVYATSLSRFSHWMPLPAPPTVEGK
jgi:hypothetical protein